MLATAIKQYRYTAEAWDFTLDSDGKPTKETFRGNLSLSLDTNSTRDLISLDCSAPIGTGTLLRNIKDRAGNLIYPLKGVNTGQPYVINYEQPLLSPWGFVDGYTLKARKLVTG